MSPHNPLVVSLREYFDERRPGSGRLQAVLFLTHPGPSLLVTAVTVAGAALLHRGLHESMMLNLAFIMLPMQLGIGALNDWADVGVDAIAKPYKPLIRGALRRRTALLVALGGFAVSLATAVHWSVLMLLYALLGVAAGVTYDLRLKRTPLSFLCFWGGLECVALLVAHAAEIGGALLTVPLSGLLALALHISNALPDERGDRAVGAITVPVALGPRRARQTAVTALLAAAAYATVCVLTGRAGTSAVVSAAGLVTAAALMLLERLRRAGFAITALLSAVAAVGWLVSLPRPFP